MSKLPKPSKGKRSISPPLAFELAIEWACGGDRQVLESFPVAKSFTRPYVIGEFWPIIFPHDMQVEVRRVRVAGLRARIPMPHREVNDLDRQIMESMAGGENIAILIDYDKIDFAEMSIEELPKGVW